MISRADLIAADDVVRGLRAADVGAAGVEILRRALERRGYPPDDIARVTAALLDREREVSTVCSDVLALPHARDAKIREFVAALGVNADGVVEGNHNLRVVVAFVSPEHDRSGHLALLASLARLSRDAHTIDALATAADPRAVVEILHWSESRSASSS